MEQARLILAIALSCLVLFLYDYYFGDHNKPVQPPKQAQSEGMNESAPLPETPLEPVKPKATLPVEGTSEQEPVTPRRKAAVITVKTPLYHVKISEAGAVFKSFMLVEEDTSDKYKYREKVAFDSPPKQMIPYKVHDSVLKTGLLGKSLPGLDNAVFTARMNGEELGPDSTVNVTGNPVEIVFSWESETRPGLVFEKRFSFRQDSYMPGLSIAIDNKTDSLLQDNLILSLVNLDPKSIDNSSSQNRYGFSGPSAMINNNLEQIELEKKEKSKTYTGLINWIGIEERYFFSCIIPAKPVDSSTIRLFLKENGILENQYMLPSFTVNPGTIERFDFNLYFGPKSLEVLSSLDNGLDKAIYFGWFDFIAKPCLILMNFLYSVIPNYGIAIIILTILIKLVLWPLGNKGYKSMNEMKKLQPLMTEIREKHKDDKKAMNDELMGLYKTYKINPLGGCLPMLLQIPVFFALYRMLYEAIELRHAPFFLWINDLSAPDRLFSFDMSIPFMTPPYGIPVLTIVMGATMFLQQKMSPPPGDPAQAKIMMFLPLIFTVIFINFSSGLVLYWLINNILSISQQYYISKKTAN